ncbi:MAG: NTP transferase domain-containing protein, partial [Hyphomicrobiales bacterium]|nr:NTP transferase domain-containing protein [Hyphomicrobiales bacterium]
MGTADKCMLALGGRPLIAVAIERLKPQVAALVISANGHPHRFDRFALPVVPDGATGHLGPLAGILAGMRWTEEHVPGSDRIVTVATDTPFFPMDLVTRLQAAAPTNRVAVARS